MNTDTRRDRLFGISMKLAIARRELDEARDQGAETAKHEARIRELQDRYHEVTWQGAA